MDLGVGKTVFVRNNEVVVSRAEYEALKAAVHGTEVPDTPPPEPEPPPFDPDVPEPEED